MTNAAPLHAEIDVLDAAARLFRQKGYAATSVREIASAAGMLPGSLHYRFASKESMLVALMERAIARLIDAVQTAIGTTHDSVDRVRLGLRAHLRLLLSGDDSVYVLLYDFRALQRDDARLAMERLRGRYESFWDGILYEAAGTGRVRAGVDPRLLRLLGFGAMNWVAQWHDPASGLDPDAIADTFFACVAFGVLGEPHRPADTEAAFSAMTAAAARQLSPYLTSDPRVPKG